MAGSRHDDTRESLVPLMSARRAIPRRSIESPAPMSLAQARLWYLDPHEPESRFYNVPLALRLSGTLHVAALERALSEIVQRHESLRTCLSFCAEEPMQAIGPPSGLALPIDDLRSYPETLRHAEVIRFANIEATKPFHLKSGTLFRTRLVRLSDQENALFLTLHQLIVDGWSLGVLLREIAALYGAYLAGSSSPLAPLPIQYADYAIWQRANLAGETVAQKLAYWKRQLHGAPEVLELPADRPRGGGFTHSGDWVPVSVPKALTRALAILSRSEGASLFMTLLACYDILLAQLSGRKEVLVGVPVAGRERVETEGLIGIFTNILAVRADCSGGQSVRTLLTQVRETTLASYAHQELPFQLLVEGLQTKRQAGLMPLIQASFNFQNQPMCVPNMAGLRLRPLSAEMDSSESPDRPVETQHVRAFRSNTYAVTYDLALFIWPEGDELRGHLEYNTELFDTHTAEAWVTHYQTLLQALAFNPDQRLCDLPILMRRGARPRLG
jgi:non-ribosomal peptide synthetase component F